MVQLTINIKIVIIVYHYPQIIIKVIVIILGPSQVVDPFNGFWASIGWCCLLYLPAILLSVSLISLYRKVTFRIMMMVAMIMIIMTIGRIQLPVPFALFCFMIIMLTQVEPYPGPLMEAQPLHNTGNGCCQSAELHRHRHHRLVIVIIIIIIVIAVTTRRNRRRWRRSRQGQGSEKRPHQEPIRSDFSFQLTQL